MTTKHLETQSQHERTEDRVTRRGTIPNLREQLGKEDASAGVGASDDEHTLTSGHDIVYPKSMLRGGEVLTRFWDISSVRHGSLTVRREWQPSEEGCRGYRVVAGTRKPRHGGE